MMNIKIKLSDFNTVRAYLKFISENISNIQNRDKVHIEFDLSGFIPIEYFVITVGILKYLWYNEIEVEIKYNINTYAQRIDFYNVLGLDVDEGFIRHSSCGRFCEIKEIGEHNSSNVVSEMIKIVQSNCPVSDELIGCLNYCWYEVVGNIIEHAESPINGYVAAQYYPSREVIRVVMLDCGIGIKSALSKNPIYANYTEEEALLECIKEGVTNGRGMGRGLYHTSEFIKSNKGTMKIYSGLHMLKVSENHTMVNDSHQWNGTLVVLDINTNTPVDLTDIFNDDIPTTALEWEECVNELW